MPKYMETGTEATVPLKPAMPSKKEPVAGSKLRPWSSRMVKI